MAIFDKYCTTVYNFTHQAYAPRLAQRLNIDYALRGALANIALWYGCNFENPSLDNNTGAAAALKKFEDLTVNITDDSKDDFWVLPGQTASALEENNNYAVLHGNADYQYCFVTGDVICNKLTESYANLNGCSIMNGGGNFGYEQETEFLKRMNGRTLNEELALAGIAKCDENTVKRFSSQGLAFRVYAYTDYSEWDFSGLKMIFRKCWYADVLYYDTQDHRAPLCTYSYYFDTSAYNEIYCTFACFGKYTQK